MYNIYMYIYIGRKRKNWGGEEEKNIILRIKKSVLFFFFFFFPLLTKRVGPRSVTDKVPGWGLEMSKFEI